MKFDYRFSLIFEAEISDRKSVKKTLFFLIFDLKMGAKWGQKSRSEDDYNKKLKKLCPQSAASDFDLVFIHKMGNIYTIQPWTC